MKMSLEKSAARRQVVAKMFTFIEAKFPRLKLTFDLCRTREECLSRKFYLQPMYKVGVAMCNRALNAAHLSSSP